MHRFFANKSNFLNNLVVLQGSDVSHIRTVLRLTVGDEIEVLDGEGTLYLVRLSEFINPPEDIVVNAKLKESRSLISNKVYKKIIKRVEEK